MRLKFLLLTLPLAAACYHAQIETGLEPGLQKIEKKWAHGFVAGLVPPSTVETAAECPNGVARIETKHSVLNILASSATSGLYSPMTITVTCAARKTASAGVIDAKGKSAQAVAEAVARALGGTNTVFVQF